MPAPEQPTITQQRQAMVLDLQNGDLQNGLQKALAILKTQPDDRDTLLVAAEIYLQQNQLDQSLVFFEKAYELSPATPEENIIFGKALLNDNQIERAIEVLKLSCDAMPENPIAFDLLADCCIKGDNFEAGINIYEYVTQLTPENPEAWRKFAFHCQLNYNYGKAIQGFQRFLQYHPDHVPTYINLGFILQDLGQFEAAEAMYQRALVIEPGRIEALNNWAYMASYHPSYSAEKVRELHRNVGNTIEQSVGEPFADHNNNASANRRLKIGYISPDFRRHACNFFIMPLFEKRNRKDFEIYCYAENQKADHITEKFKSLSDHWFVTDKLSNNEVCKKIRADGIDILIDLAGHCDRSRMDVMAKRPAPVSMTWLGTGNTTGLDRIDYFLADEGFVPTGEEAGFSEKVWRLPNTFMCYRPDDIAPPPSPSPFIKNGYITFGSLSRLIRFNDRVISVWSAILNRVPDARLLLHTFAFNDADTIDEFRLRFQEKGINPDRLDLVYHHDYWQSYHALDIALDPFPHNCGTTTFETLWSGVPVINLKQRAPVGCFGRSILPHIGLEDCVTETEDAYIDKAVSLSSDKARLQSLRHNLRDQMRQSALCDEQGFIRDIEAAYRQIWLSWLKK